MAGKIRMPNKKTTIAIAIIVAILAIVAIIGTVVFLKDRGSTEAAEIGNNQSQENGTTGNTPATPETNTNNGEVAGNPETLPNAGEQGNAGNAQNNPVANNGAQNPANGTVNNGGVQNNQVAGNAGQNAANNIQETTIVENQTVYTETPWETQGVTWAPLSVNANLPLAEIKAEKDALEINKVCETKTGENLTTKGEELTYKIIVKNNSGKELNGIEVKDRIPSQTTYVDNSVDNGGNVTKLANGKEVVAWTVDLKENEEKTLSFKVIVNATEGTIANVAVVNGEETNETHTAIVTSTKTAEVVGKEKGTAAKVGDKIKYTITVKNTGDVEGKATVKDESLAKLIEDGILEVEEASKETAEKLMAGTEIDVAANLESKVEFTVVVKKVSGAIKNVATIGEEKPEETVDTVNITGTKTNNDTDKVVKTGDEFEYTIKLTNSGNTTGTVKVTDQVPEQLEVIGTTPKATVNGNSVNFGNVTVTPTAEVELKIKVKVKANATGTIANIAKIDDKTEIPDPDPIKTANITGTKTNNDTDKVVRPGDTFDYTITLTNSGNAAGTGTVTDQVPEQLKVTGTNPTATVNGNSVNFGEVEVVPGTPKTLTISVEVKENATGTIANIAKIDDKTEIPDPDPIKTVNITGTKTNNDKDKVVKPGDTFDYTITLTNSGNTAGKVTVTDEVPEQLEITGTTPTATVNGNSVNFGEVEVQPGTPVELKISVKVKADATGEFTNVAVVDGKDTPDEKVTIENISNITGEKTNNDADKKVKPGDEVVYSIKLSNSGNVAGSTTVTDKLPSGVTFKEASEQGKYENGNVIWQNVEVPVGTNTKELTVTVTINETATGKIQNTAIIENEDKHDEGLDTVKITASKTNNIRTTAKVNEEVIYTITAVNNGTVAGDAVITDTIPNELQYVTATLVDAGDDTISYENGKVIWNVKDLGIGKENARTLTVKATVKDFEGTTKSITNTVEVDGKQTDTSTIEAGKPVITSTKTSAIISCERNELTGTQVHEGDKIRYTITVSNDGTVEKQINILDQIKNGLTYVENTLTAEFAGETVTGAVVENGIVKLENYTLVPGGTLTITFTVSVNQLAEGEVSKTIDKNVAVVDGTDIPDNKEEYEVLKPIISAEKESQIIECSKQQKEGTIVHEGDQIKYTIRVANTGRTSGKVTVEDTIQEGLTYVQGSVNAKVDGVAISGVTVTNGKVQLTNYNLEEGKTLVIEFTVSVNTLPEGQYSKEIATNIAVVNGNNTPDKTGEYDVVKPHIESDKSSEIVECAVNQTTGRKVHQGDKIRYTITVSNNGTDSDIVNVTDSIPNGVTYVANTLSAKLQDNTEVQVNIIDNKQVKLEAYTLNGGSTLTITFDVTVNELEEGVYSKQIANNIAVVNGNNVPDDGGYEVQKPQIESSKVVNKQVAEYGEELEYTITAKNLSTIKADINISDPIPAGTEYVANSITINGKAVADSTNYKDGKVIYNGELTAKDQTVTIKFRVKVTETELHKEIKNIANINNEEKTATTKIAKIVTVGTESTRVTPIDLVLVLDTSGSMKNDNKINDLKASAKTLVNKVFENKTESTVSIVTYSASGADKGTYNYSQRTRAINAIDGLSADGGTNIYAGLEKANSKVSSLGTAREKVVVFLTDGTPTIPSYDYIEGVHSSDNANYQGYTNNVKDKIVEQAELLKSKSKQVYSIGLGLNNLSTTNVRSASECTVVEETIDIQKEIQIDQENHTFTVTVTNPSNNAITLDRVSAQFSNIKELKTVKDGERKNRKTEARWENVNISANGTITLTGTYEPDYEGYFSQTELTPSATVDVRYTTTKTCTLEAHKEMFNGKPLYSVIKTANGKQYHGITESDYANYLLSKIASNGTPMNVNNVAIAFDKILQDISSTTNTYTVQEGTIITIPETHNIISKVTVKIGNNSSDHTIDELKTGVNGLVYKEGTGFEWTITGETLLTNKLSLEYKIDE